MKRKTRRKLAFLGIGFAVFSVLFALLVFNHRLLSWHLKASNFLYYRGQSEASQDIVIVAIDDKSFALKNASELRTLRFSKADYAKVIENLERAGAQVVGVDIVFSEVSPEADQAVLIETLRQYDNIILAAEPKLLKTTGLKPLKEFIEPRPENLGSILFEADEDNTIRRQRLVYDDAQAPYAFALQIVRKALGLLPEDSKALDNAYQLMSFAVRIDGRKILPATIPLDPKGQMMIDFFGPPNSFPSISFADVFQGKFNERRSGKPLDLKGKIVLVGEMGTGIHDEQYVPTSVSRAMPGVEIHANAIQTILDGRFLRDQSWLGIYAVAMGAVLLGLALFLGLGIVGSLIVLVIGFMAYAVFSWVAFEYGIVLNVIYPYLAWICAFVVAYIFRYFTEERAARQTEQAFSKYVSATVVKKILENPKSLKLGGEKKEMTVLFSDIAGFTTLSEKATPEKLVEQLNEYLDAMTVIIMDHEGTVDKYIGDAIMAFWGAPIPQEDHAVRACLTALEYQKRLVELRALWVGRGQLPFSARVGLNTGTMVVGNMGSHRRFDYTVIGDAVNLGARLEGVNKFFDTDILISETTYEGAKAAIEVREIDLITVKGKTKPVRIYELLAKKGELTELQEQVNKVFHQGLAAYREQEWDEAIKIFKKALKLCPKDGPSKTYIERCGALKKEKLPENWDGSYTLKTK
jgi:adenylate cyclase